MAEAYAEHRQDLEKQAMQQERADLRWGRGIAAAVVAAVLGTCVYALHIDEPEFAETLGSWTIVALAAVFIAGKAPDWFNKADSE